MIRQQPKPLNADQLNIALDAMEMESVVAFFALLKKWRDDVQVEVSRTSLRNSVSNLSVIGS